MNLLRLLHGIVFTGVCLACAESRAALIATYDLVPLTSTTISAGQSVTVQVNLITQAESVGAGFYLQEATGAGFAITGVDRSSTPFTDFSSTSAEITAANSPLAGNNVLNPGNDKDLGGLETNFTEVAAGTYNLGTFVLSSAGVAAGTYWISMGGPLEVIAGAANGYANYATINSDSFSITIDAAEVPEPGSLLLCGAAALVFSRRLRRPRPQTSDQVASTELT